MIRVLLLTSLLSIFFLNPLSSRAQGGFSIGPKGGFDYTVLNSKTIKSVDSIRSDLNLGYNVGLSLGWNLYRYNFGVTSGVYLRKIKHSHAHNAPDGWETSYDLTYLEVPLLIRLRPRGNMLTKSITYGGFYFEFGAQMGFLMSAKTTYSDSLTNSNIDAKSLYESSNLAGVIGLGAHQFGLPQFALTHGIRFTYGLGDIVKNAITEQPIIGKPTNTITIGYLMSITFKFPSGRF